ncbi:MAG TPA: Holliday junction resolvase RuvX [Phycisphaerae bacterium]|nr:Holliday junction resolvase RuvX [Phycisphaerae bacterium]
MRAIAIDYGARRTGIAIGDSETRIALPFEMFQGLPDDQLAHAIAALVAREKIDTVLVGMPLHADGSISAQSKLTQRFLLTLRHTLDPAIPIHRASEYLSTHGAEGKLAGHFTRHQKRQRVDALAAANILQDFLDALPRDSL